MYSETSSADDSVGYTGSDETNIVAFIEPHQADPYGWMDDRWAEDEYEGSDTLLEMATQGGMSRSAGERPNTPLNTDEI